MVSSPPGSLVQRTPWYVALGLAAALVLPGHARAGFVPQVDPPTVAYTIDGNLGNNGWYVGSGSAAKYIVVHWAVSGDVTSTNGCEPAVQISDPNTGTTLTCTATGGGGTTSVTTKLLKVDATPPATSVTPSRAPNGAGWYRSSVALQWSGTDSTSGIASCTVPLTYNGPDTSGTVESGTCSDNAGNWSSAAVTIHYDSTAPTTTPTPTPTPNANGWLNTPVQVAWQGSDATSNVASCTASSSYSGPDTPGATLSGSCTDNAGNTSSASFTVKYDTKAPTTTAAPARAPNSAGWFNTPVTISGSDTDSLSGTGPCTSTTYGGPDTSGTSKTVTCTDQAGNSSTGSYVVKYDATPPAVSASTTRPADQGPWFNHPVDVVWSGTDGTSGIASCSSLTYNGPDNANASVQGSCTDAAGNSTTAAFGLKYDSKPPVTTASSSPAPNANGWVNSKPDVTWSGSDATSGVASCTKTTYSGPETAGTTLGGTCTDNAGNTSGSSFTVRYDATPPSTAAAPARAPNAAGWFNAPVTISGSGTDALSGIDSCTSVGYGGPDTTGTSRSVTCTDKAGNSSSGSYAVKYDATPPAVTGGTPARPPDANGWYNHGVRVDFGGTDATSGIASCSAPIYDGPDGANAAVHGTCTDNAGNTGATDFGLQYDATPPTVAVAAARPADHDGWYNRPVSISWSGTDTTSGIDSCTPALTYSGPDSANASSGGGCTDRAGNSASPPALSFRYDSTPPAVQAVASRPPDANGWYNHGLRVDWNGADPVAGTASCSSYAYSGPDAAAVQPSGTCTDKAGNTSAPVAFGFRFDSTPPTGISAAPARPPDHGGWYNRPFAVKWSGSDALSGIASCTTATYGGPTNGATAMSGSCTDQAGNTSGAVGYAFKYDGTPPAFDRLSLTPHDDAVAVRWRASGATSFQVTRKPGVGGAASSVVYDGAASSFADRKVDNYVRYTYVVTAEDEAGNELARSAAATPMPVLFAPRPGARVGPGSSPLLAWRAAGKARYYNVQLWLGGRVVGSWWPAGSRLRLPARWRFGGSAHTLEPGSYTWYVWPGRGPRRLGRYGKLLGKSTFVVGS
ncbi:MAG TPA: hypothetical protein VFJ75_02835 [Gaiellaceae bacterium]|nr:hypothetical protein [Gaiellaceae bacterium]